MTILYRHMPNHNIYFHQEFVRDLYLRMGEWIGTTILANDS